MKCPKISAVAKDLSLKYIKGNKIRDIFTAYRAHQ